MHYYTAFVLGLVGSLHCLGMCGPLLLAVPGGAGTSARFLTGRLIYHLGRISVYALLGAVFGLVGQTFALAGWQRWVSIIAGSVILIGLLASTRFAVQAPAFKFVQRLKSHFASLLARRDLSSQFFMGALNGLLPCGLVYVACAGAVATGHILSGIGFMAAFGLGTLPMLLSVSFLGKKLSFSHRQKLQKLIPMSIALVGVLLILRGMALDIPYVSPALGQGHDAHSACH